MADYEWYQNCKNTDDDAGDDDDDVDAFFLQCRKKILTQEEWIDNILFKEFKPLQNNLNENICFRAANSQVSVFLW